MRHSSSVASSKGARAASSIGAILLLIGAVTSLPYLALAPLAPSAVASSPPGVVCTTSQTAGSNVTVNIQSLAFSPDSITVVVGVNNTVQWHNLDGITHTVTSNTGAFNSALNSGKVFTCTFNAEGVFQYHCTIHPFMTGSVSVEAAPGSPHGTTSHIVTLPFSVTVGSLKPTVSFSVTDIDPKPTTPTGNVSFSDGGAGGAFSISACTLTKVITGLSACSVKYTPPTTVPPGGIVTLSGNYAGDFGHFNSTDSSLLVVKLRNVLLTMSPSFPRVIDSPVIVNVRLLDTSLGTKSPPSGTVSFSDGGRGGAFNSTSCTPHPLTLISSGCAVSYLPGAYGLTRLNATYSGDGQHGMKIRITPIFSNMRPTKTFIVSSVASAPRGTHVTLNATVIDTGLGNPSAPAGIVKWIASRAGGSFSPLTCTLAAVNSTASKCSVTYTLPLTIGRVVITARFVGDPIQKPSVKVLYLTAT